MAENTKVYGSDKTLSVLGPLAQKFDDAVGGNVIALSREDLPELEKFQGMRSDEALPLAKYYLTEALRRAYPAITPPEEKHALKNAQDILESIYANETGLMNLPHKRGNHDKGLAGIMILPTEIPISTKSSLWDMEGVHLKFPSMNGDEKPSANLSFNTKAPADTGLFGVQEDLRPLERHASIFGGTSNRGIPTDEDLAVASVYKKTFERIKEDLVSETDIAKKLAIEGSYNIARENPRLYFETLKQLQKEGAFDDNPAAKQEALRLLDAVDKYVEFVDEAPKNDLVTDVLRKTPLPDPFRP